MPKVVSLRVNLIGDMIRKTDPPEKREDILTLRAA